MRGGFLLRTPTKGHVGDLGDYGKALEEWVLKGLKEVVF